MKTESFIKLTVQEANELSKVLDTAIRATGLQLAPFCVEMNNRLIAAFTST